MRKLKVFAFAAVASTLLAGSLQAQTGTGWALFTGVNGSNYWGVYTNQYKMAFKDLSPANSPLLPQAGSSTWGSPVDIFCIDYYNEVHWNDPYLANFTNLGSDPATVAIGTGGTTRAGGVRDLNHYLAAAYLAGKIAAGANKNLYSGAIWSLMSGAPLTFSVTGDVQALAADALLNHTGLADVNPYEWVVVTDRSAVGISSGGRQEFLTHVSVVPEPATLLLLGTGLLATLMAAGALRRSAV